MKALSLIQPWASLVAIGAKQYETRSWQPHHAGRIAIHASKRMTLGHEYLCYTEPFFTMLKPNWKAGVIGFPFALPLGAIIATARLGVITPTDEIEPWLSAQERAFGDYSAGRFAWSLTDVKPLGEPIPCRGILGLWDVPQDIVPKLLAA